MANADRVVARIRALAAKQDTPLIAQRVARDHPRVHAAAIAQFGSFARALRAAGLPQRRIPRRLSKAAVIAELRALDRRGVRMSSVDIIQAGRNDLISACWRHFRGFVRAREAAGIRRPPAKPYERTWNKDSVIAAIRRVAAKQGDLAPSRVDRALLNAGSDNFGSWREAIEAAGLDYDKILIRPHRYDDDTLLEWLREVQREHPNMTLRELHEHPPHGSIVGERFGSVEAAAEAAGIVGWPVRKQHERYTREDVLDELRIRAATNRRYSTDALRRESPGLHTAARRYFRTIDRAYAAAGLAKPWDALRDQRMDEVRAAIRERARAGRTLVAKDVLAEDKNIARWARRYYGSWAEAVAAAAPKAVRQPRGSRSPLSRRELMTALRVAQKQATAARREGHPFLRRTPFDIDGHQRRSLRKLIRDRRASDDVIRRSVAILLCADGFEDAVVCDRLVADTKAVDRWRGLFLSNGVAGLADRGLSPAVVEKIAQMTRTRPSVTAPAIAKIFGTTKPTVYAIWKRLGLRGRAPSAHAEPLL